MKPKIVKLLLAMAALAAFVGCETWGTSPSDILYLQFVNDSDHDIKLTFLAAPNNVRYKYVILEPGSKKKYNGPWENPYYTDILDINYILNGMAISPVEMVFDREVKIVFEEDSPLSDPDNYTELPINLYTAVAYTYTFTNDDYEYAVLNGERVGGQAE